MNLKAIRDCLAKFLEVVENKQGQCLSTSLRVEFSLDKGLPQSIILNSHITLCSILRGETSINNRMTTKECVCNEICVMHIATLQKKSLEFCHLEIIFRKKAKKNLYYNSMEKNVRKVKTQCIVRFTTSSIQ